MAGCRSNFPLTLTLSHKGRGDLSFLTSPLVGEVVLATQRRVRGVLLSIITLLCFFFPSIAWAKDGESAYDRVMRTETIRCGYFIWPPFVMKDPNTGVFSGIFYDLTEEMASRLDLKVNWDTELNFATYLQDLDAGKYDLECSGGWPNATRGKFVSYTTPLFYIANVPFVRVDETRFSDSANNLNSADIKVATIDGETSQILRRTLFPLTQEVGLPQSSNPTELMMNVITGKADVTFLDSVSGIKFMSENPNKLKILDPQNPLKLTPQNHSIKSEETRFKDMIDTAYQEMFLDGTIHRILEKYDPKMKSFYMVAKPYEAPK